MSSGTCLVTAGLGMVSEKGRERKRERDFGLLGKGALVVSFGFVGCLVSDDTLYPYVYSFLW